MLSTFAAAVLLMMAAPATAGREVILTQVSHRHGARTPIVPSAYAKQVCGDAGCGNLNIQGMAMLEALGDYLNARYVWNNWTGFSAADARLAAPPQADYAALQNGDYSFQRVASRSTDVPRTLQSAGAMLRGLFSNLSTSLPPVIHTVELDTDTLLLSDLTVGLYVPIQYLKQFPPLSDWTQFASYLPPAQLKELGDAFGFTITACATPTVQELADDVWTYRACALVIHDIAASFLATGALPNYPTVQGNYTQLQAFAQANNKRVYQYNATDPTDVARGPVLYPLAQTLTDNMKVRAAQLNATPTPAVPATIMFEYSAHDTTVMPVAAFLGHNELSLPPFGYAIIVELVRDTVTGEHYVQAWQGAPAVLTPPAAGTPITAAHYTYDVKSLSIGCRRYNANVLVTDGTCTLDEFNAYIENIAPQTPAGSTCYLPPSVITQIGCDKPEAPEQISCSLYRTVCPQFACPSGMYLTQSTAGDLTCYDTGAVAASTKGEIKVGEAAAAAAGSAIGGVLLGVMLTLAANMLCKCWGTPKAEGYVQAK